jgi:hypothetical protein
MTFDPRHFRASCLGGALDTGNIAKRNAFVERSSGRSFVFGVASHRFHGRLVVIGQMHSKTIHGFVAHLKK